MSKLAEKVAVVTGASQGIGAGIAKALAAEGAAVVVNYLKNKQAAASIAEAITQAGGKAIAVQADVAEVASAEAIIDAAMAFGPFLSKPHLDDSRTALLVQMGAFDSNGTHPIQSVLASSRSTGISNEVGQG